MEKTAIQFVTGRAKYIYRFYFIIFSLLVGFLLAETLIEQYVLASPITFFEHLIPSTILYIIFLIFAFLYAKWTNTTAYEMGFHGSYVPKSLFIGFLATSGYLIAVVAFQLPLSYTQPWEIVVLLLFTMLIGVTEETLFRGYIQANYEKEISQMRAVLLTGMLFAFLHVPSYIISGNYLNILSLPSLVLVGLILGFIRVHTGNIWGVILAHATWDFYMFLFTPEITTELMSLIAALAASGGMWGTILLSMFVAKWWIDRPTQMPYELKQEYSRKIERLIERTWRLQGSIQALQFNPNLNRRKIERLYSIIRTNEDSIEVLKIYIPQINENSYKILRKLLPLKMKWIKVANLLKQAEYSARFAIYQSKLLFFERQIFPLEQELRTLQPFIEPRNLKE